MDGVASFNIHQCQTRERVQPVIQRLGTGVPTKLPKSLVKPSSLACIATAILVPAAIIISYDMGRIHPEVSTNVPARFLYKSKDGRDKEWVLQPSVLLMIPDRQKVHGHVASTMHFYKLITHTIFLPLDNRKNIRKQKRLANRPIQAAMKEW